MPDKDDAFKAKRLRRALSEERVLLQKGRFYITRTAWLHTIFGWLYVAATLYLIIKSWPLFSPDAEENSRFWNTPAVLIVLALLVGILFSFRFKIGGKAGFFVYTLLFVSLPFASYYMVECLGGCAAYARKPEYIFMNIVAYALVYLLFLAIFGNYRWAAFCGTSLLYAFALCCYFVLLFRGTPFVPLDILSSGTAANVVGHYVFELSPRWTISMVQAGLILALGFQLGRANLRRLRWKMSLRVLAVLIAVGSASIFFSGSYLQNHSYTISYWNQQENYEKYGSWLAFCINIRNIYPERPENYSADTVSDIVEELLAEDGQTLDGDGAYNMLSGETDYTVSEKHPNIIMIMNESFSDLQSLGNGFSTNEEVLPFFNSLTENTVRGTLQVSVSGGGTACTEYEVLTGNAQRFLPIGAVAYSANIHTSTPSIAWNLQESGYSTSAFHPYYASGWNREKVYNYLGFEESTFLEDILPEKIIEMSAGERIAAVEKIDPDDGDVYNRDYMSDHYDYKILEELYEERDTDKPFFLFNVTIQNHGGYEHSSDNFTESIVITDMEGDYPQVERYLSLVHASDAALEELINYFSDVDEPTIVVFFGDHQPSVDDGFYEELFNTADLSDLSVEEKQSCYQTPFIIWANYDIPEQDVGLVSANYLSTLVMEVAEVELTPYQRYLASLYERVPAISNLGFVDADGNASLKRDGLAIESLVDDYQSVAYNNLLDYSHRDWSIFTVSGEALPDTDD